ncbi:hypothetical protein OJAV_G00232440 [Oryzias javanicus]|uniref:Uncharacterized protein n=1 Tax=Oryzias javanicus TaxID=123683 RepID=A0A437C0X9_ORYJA|nr:hypothetical protein OJAV_G00232440 [Oryzias javanicus]
MKGLFWKNEFSAYCAEQRDSRRVTAVCELNDSRRQTLPTICHQERKTHILLCVVLNCSTVSERPPLSNSDKQQIGRSDPKRVRRSSRTSMQ